MNTLHIHTHTSHMVNERMVELFQWFSGERTLLHATLIHAELGCLGFHQVHGAEIKTGQNLYRSGGECTAKKKRRLKRESKESRHFSAILSGSQVHTAHIERLERTLPHRTLACIL